MKQQPLHILFDDSPLHTAHAHRGIGAYARELIRALRKRKEVVVSLASETNEPAADIIHYPLFDLFFNTLPVLLGKKVVVTIHDVIPLFYPQYYKSGIRGKVRFFQQRLALLFAKAVITVSEQSKKDIIRFLGIPARKIFVVHNGVSSVFAPQKPKKIATVSKELKLPAQYLLYVGDINYNKNIPQLVKMLKFLPENYHLVCVGKQFVEQDIPEWRWIEAQVTMSDVAERVHYISDLPVTETEKMAGIYAGAVAYVQPSLHEGFGLPIIEAMRCLCPVVSSNRGSLPEIGGAHAVYVEPEAAELAKGVETVLEWSATMRKRKLQAAHTWSKRYTWQKAAAKTVAIYTALARQK